MAVIEPMFEAHACEMAIPDGLTADDFSCGSAVLPLNWASGSGESVRVEVAVLRARQQPASDVPLVFVGGGPGAVNLEGYLQSHAASVVAPLNEARDIVFFDQRGTGHSTPRLRCPETEEAFFESYGVEADAAADKAVMLAAYRACHERLVAAGVPLSHHTSVDVALDIAAFMKLLEYPSYHLYGISYGTRIVQAMMRAAPEGIASATLDSTVELLPQDTWPARMQYSFDVLVSECEASASCVAGHPDLRGALELAVSELNASAHRATVSTEDGSKDLYINGDRLLAGLHSALYRADLIPLLPSVIDQTALGAYAYIDAFAPELVSEPGSFDWGYYASMSCSEETPFRMAEQIATANEGVSPDFVRALGEQNEALFAEVCKFWAVEVVPDEEVTAIESDIPTLVLAGLFDPATPPAKGERVAEKLSNSQYVLFEGLGHGVLRSDVPAGDGPSCAQTLAVQFLDAPSSPVDASCVATLPNPL